MSALTASQSTSLIVACESLVLNLRFQATNNWFRAFHHHAAGAHAGELDSKGYFADKSTFYTRLHEWFAGFHGTMYRSSMQWVPGLEKNQFYTNPLAFLFLIMHESAR